jgi:hypothetical protein
MRLSETAQIDLAQRENASILRQQKSALADNADINLPCLLSGYALSENGGIL